MAKKDRCKSCGMPMEDISQHGGRDINNPFCVYCTDKKGKLKSREEVRAGMVAFFMKSENKTRDKAEKYVDEHMNKMPAWKE